MGVRASDAAYHKAELVRGCTPLYAEGDMHARLASGGKRVSLDGVFSKRFVDVVSRRGF